MQLKIKRKTFRIISWEETDPKSIIPNPNLKSDVFGHRFFIWKVITLVYIFFLKVATTARSTQRALVAVADGLGLVRGDLILANS